MFDCLLQEDLLLRLVAAFELGALEEGLSEFVDDFVIFAEIEAALIQFRIAILEDAAKFGDGFIQIAILLIHESVEPGNGPARRGRIGSGCALQGADGVIEPAFLEVDTREVERPVRTTQLLNNGESVGCLNELTFFAAFVSLQKEADAIVVPALPD